MAMFLLTHSDNASSEKIEARASKKGVMYRKLTPCSYAMVSKTIVTPKEMYEFLDVNDGEFGQLIIVRFDSYWGFHDKGVWEWLKGHGENL